MKYHLCTGTQNPNKSLYCNISSDLYLLFVQAVVHLVYESGGAIVFLPSPPYPPPDSHKHITINTLIYLSSVYPQPTGTEYLNKFPLVWLPAGPPLQLIRHHYTVFKCRPGYRCPAQSQFPPSSPFPSLEPCSSDPVTYRELGLCLRYYPRCHLSGPQFFLPLYL